MTTLTPERAQALREASRPKLEAMRARLRELRTALVAFSGGVDSALVLKVAVEELGQGAVALTALSASVAPEEREESATLARQLGATHVVVDSHELDDPRYAQNPTNRCYFCKSELYALCERERAARGLAAVLDGFNADDVKDHRPGQKAAREHQVRSPLAEAGLTKDEIRAWSLELGLPTWDKPAVPCLASRIPYGTQVTRERLDRIGAAESALRKLGFKVFRVRYHDAIARLELSAEEYPRMASPELRAEVDRAVRAAGFEFVVLDLQPFRSGRLNEAAGVAAASPAPALRLPVLGG